MRKKRILAALMALIIVLSTTTIVFAKDWSEKQTFKDVGRKDWFYGYVEDLADQGIVHGYGDGTYGPLNQLTRQQAAKMIAIAAGLDYKGKTANFPDVPKDSEFSGYIAALVETKAIDGFTDGTFGPTETITRSQATKMIAAAFGLVKGDMEADFPDTIDLAPKDKAPIDILASLGIIKGYNDGKEFRPFNNVTRAQFAKMLAIAQATAAVQRAEAEGATDVDLANAKKLVDNLPDNQDIGTKESLEERLDALKKEEEPGPGPAPGPDSGSSSVASIYNINQKTSYTTIQDAVNHAYNDDTILVKSGDYREQIIIDKPLRLLGPNYGINGQGTRVDEARLLLPEIDIPEREAIVQVRAEDVEISGFKFDDEKRAVHWGADIYNMTGLEVAGDRAKITNNIFTGFSLFQLGLVGDDYLVSGNFFTSFGFDSDKFSLYILEASSGQIISNVWEDTPGFLLQPGQKSGNWTIKDNQMTIYNTAIDLRPDPISAIAPNQKILAGRLMPEVADRSASWTVEANQIRFESAADRPDYFEKYQYGIYLGSFTNNISLEIKDNYINNANTFGKPSIGIMSVVDTANAKDITIEGNTFINGTWGAYIIGAKPNIQDVFSNNTFDQGSVIEGLTISKPEPVPGTGARHLSY